MNAASKLFNITKNRLNSEKITASEMFKIAHVIARASKDKAAGVGHYQAYFAYGLRVVNKLVVSCNKITMEIKAKINKWFKKIGVEKFHFMKSVKTSCTFGVFEFEKRHLLDKAIRALPSDQFAGKIYLNHAGKFCACKNGYKYSEEII